MTENSEFIVKYTTKDIMDKLESMHKSINTTNGTVKFHTKLIWSAYGFTFAVLLTVLKLFMNCKV